MSITDLIGLRDMTEFAVAEDEAGRVQKKPICEYAEELKGEFGRAYICTNQKTDCKNLEENFCLEKKMKVCLNPTGYVQIRIPSQTRNYLH